MDALFGGSGTTLALAQDAQRPEGTKKQSFDAEVETARSRSKDESSV